LKDQLRLLLQLQAIDVRVQELQATIAQLPKPLENDKQSLARLEAMLADEKARLTETERWRNDQEGLMQREEEAIRKAKAKVQTAKGAKDYSAANREVDNKRRARSEREDEVIKVMEALEKARGDIEAHEAHVIKLRERVEAEGTRIAGQIAELQAEAAQGATGRDQLVAQIDPALLRRYEHVRKQRGSSVAAVRKGVCTGCHMSIPPQLNNLLVAAKAIQSCPRCNRILYREELLAEGSEGASDGAPGGGGDTGSEVTA
jgi:hypothetical protein